MAQENIPDLITVTNRWVFSYTGNAMLMWTLAGAVLIVLGGIDLDPTQDELS